MDFQSFWVATWGHAALHEGVDRIRKCWPVPPQQPLLVISNEDSDDWLRVYDPKDRIQGYIDWAHASVMPDPAIAKTDPTVQRLAGWHRIGPRW